MTPRTLAATVLALAVAPTLPGCVIFLEAPDAPRILDVDAFCARDAWWELTADVAHPDGDAVVEFVWAEVTLVEQDLWGDRWFTDLGEVDLAYEGGGLWFAEVPSDPFFLDCFHPAEYDLRFVAEDPEGDRDTYTITR